MAVHSEWGTDRKETSRTTGSSPTAESPQFVTTVERVQPLSDYETGYRPLWSLSLVIRSKSRPEPLYSCAEDELIPRFWGDMIHRADAGPAPIPQKKLNPDNLAEAIKVALSPEAKTAAGKMGEQIRKEKGEEKGVESFHRHLPLKNMR